MSSISSTRTTYQSMTFPATTHFTEPFTTDRDSLSDNLKAMSNSQTTYLTDPARLVSNRGVYLRDDLNSPHFNPIVESLNFNISPTSYGTPSTGLGSFGGWVSETMDSLLKSQTVDFSNSSSTPCSDLYQLTSPSITDQVYATSNSRCTLSTSRPIERNQYNALNQPRHSSSGFMAPYGQDNYQHDVNGRAYDIKPVFTTGRPLTLTSSLNTNSSRQTSSEPNSAAALISGRLIGSTQALSVSAASPMTCSVMMTPDSSTAGFAGNRFGASSDDGEVSPTPTTGSGGPMPQTPGSHFRKTAPTLATGRRNLKGEPVQVDPDEADRRMKRRERNRKSAQKCRERKVQRTHELQSQVECFQMETNRLLQELDSCRSQARQCVTLLQLHCPGVPIPYMSCLHETPETLDGSRGGDISASMMQTDSLKQESLDTNSLTGWKLKLNGMENGATSVTSSLATAISTTPTVAGTVATSLSEGSDHRSSIPEGLTNNELYSTLPTMISLHSHLHTPNRSKSLLTFAQNCAPNGAHDSDNKLTSAGVALRSPPCHHQATRNGSGNTTGACNNNSSGNTTIFSTAIREPTSASSSSSCSTYDLGTFNVFDQQQSILMSPFNGCTTDLSCTVVPQSLHDLHQGVKPDGLGSSIPLQCDDWNSTQFLAATTMDSINLGEPASVSSISSSPRLLSGFSTTGGDLTDQLGSSDNVLMPRSVKKGNGFP